MLNNLLFNINIITHVIYLILTYALLCHDDMASYNIVVTNLENIKIFWGWNCLSHNVSLFQQPYFAHTLISETLHPSI